MCQYLWVFLSTEFSVQRVKWHQKAIECNPHFISSDHLWEESWRHPAWMEFKQKEQSWGEIKSFQDSLNSPCPTAWHQRYQKKCVNHPHLGRKPYVSRSPITPLCWEIFIAHDSWDVLHVLVMLVATVLRAPSEPLVCPQPGKRTGASLPWSSSPQPTVAGGGPAAP